MTKDLRYPDALIADVLRSVKTIALVGASPKPDRPSHEVMKFLQALNYRVIPVNPGLAGQVVLGEMARESLLAIGEPVDMVDIFRRPEAVAPIVDQAIAIKAKVVWMQLGVRDDAAAAKAQAAGLIVIMDRCPKIETARLTAAGLL
ncbi:CoA-binding protein [Rhodoblastus sp.]|uniref:CoA-binding protein n=1 Tax=Rhodoblastus sp. TaxID=1962975 RepID=UPI003F9C5EB0